ncbi:hypothetical protein WME89_33925 [Sorangium sp. So ce321]|uniref:hypothetical protein n=1 Tax=Sorangium sp. So ce321 TaxID=3133300 RepID=UPI003F608263
MAERDLASCGECELFRGVNAISHLAREQDSALRVIEIRFAGQSGMWFITVHEDNTMVVCRIDGNDVGLACVLG